jgi:foldase protein PrsA
LRRSRGISLALGAFFVLAIGLAACGGGVPGDSVAQVGSTPITQTTFKHWLGIAAHSQQQQGSTTPITVPDPPDYKNCVAQLRKTTPAPAKGQSAPTDAQLKTQCLQEYTGLRDQVMQFLISAQWITGEAADQHVKVSDSQVQKSFTQTKAQSFPKESDFTKFLQTSGMSMNDILFRVRLNLMSTQLRNKVVGKAGTVSDAQAAAYYSGHKAQFAQPERRDLLVVLTKTKAQADKAHAAVQHGSWAAAAKKYSIDPATKTQGGRLLGVTKGQQDKALDTAIFAAKKGQIVGPVKSQFGYYVFRVTKVTPPSQQAEAQAAPAIKQLLASQGQQSVLTTFVNGFQKKWKGRTSCRNGYVISTCKNYTAPKSTSTTPTTSTGAAP